MDCDTRPWLVVDTLLVCVGGVHVRIEKKSASCRDASPRVLARANGRGPPAPCRATTATPARIFQQQQQQKKLSQPLWCRYSVGRQRFRCTSFTRKKAERWKRNAPGVHGNGLSVEGEVHRVGVAPGPILGLQHGDPDVGRAGKVPCRACSLQHTHAGNVFVLPSDSGSDTR